MVLTPASRVVVAPEHVACLMGAETVILNVAVGRYFGLGTIGTRIWQLLQEPTTVEGLRRAITAEYAVDAERCEADLLAFVGQLVDARLVRLLEADAR
jgi:hypothetical protein